MGGCANQEVRFESINGRFGVIVKDRSGVTPVYESGAPMPESVVELAWQRGTVVLPGVKFHLAEETRHVAVVMIYPGDYLGIVHHGEIGEIGAPEAAFSNSFDLQGHNTLSFVAVRPGAMVRLYGYKNRTWQTYVAQANRLIPATTEQEQAYDDARMERYIRACFRGERPAARAEGPRFGIWAEAYRQTFRTSDGTTVTASSEDELVELCRQFAQFAPLHKWHRKI